MRSFGSWLGIPPCEPIHTPAGVRMERKFQPALSLANCDEKLVLLQCDAEPRVERRQALASALKDELPPRSTVNSQPCFIPVCVTEARAEKPRIRNSARKDPHRGRTKSCIGAEPQSGRFGRPQCRQEFRT